LSWERNVRRVEQHFALRTVSRFPAKHESMNKTNRRVQRTAKVPVALQAYPHSGRELFYDLKHRVARELGAKMTIRRFSRIIGVPHTSAYHWLEAYPLRQVVGFILALERLSGEERRDFLEKYCREFPHLRHKRLALSAADLLQLFGILEQPVGLTLIQGGTQASRTFFLTSLANTWSAKDRKHRSAVGIDLHFPSQLVPVDTVTYIDSKIGPKRTRSAVDQVWPKIQTSKVPLILLNGVWSAMPELRGDLLRLAKNMHVILADAEPLAGGDLKPNIAPFRVLTLSESSQDSAKIHVRFCEQNL